MPYGLALAHRTQERAQRFFAYVPPIGDEPSLDRALAAHAGDVVAAEPDVPCSLFGGGVRSPVDDARTFGGVGDI
jgi:hypothetical protein